MAAIHSDKAFEKDLTELRQRLLRMGSLVETAISRSVRALSERKPELCVAVKEGDEEVNRLELDIDELCRRILALRQPAASDLRFITTALKIVTDLERCGDLAVNITERVADLLPGLPVDDDSISHDIETLVRAAQAQLSAALTAFVDADADKAEKILEGDDFIDALYAKLFHELLSHMMEDPRRIRRATGLMFIAKHLERVGDHAVNVAEMVIYMVRGTDIRHPRSRRVR